MVVAYRDTARTVFVAAVLLALGMPLGGCATSASSSLMDAHAEVPAPAKAGGYLPVEDLPAPRKNPAMTADERSKLQKDLLATRDRQAAEAKAQAAATADPAKP